jgi:type IX secretion system PorP/SprF family membrane protein
MKDKKLKLGLWGLLIFSCTVLKGQDPQFSQFYNSSLYYNPATIGISGDLRFLSTYRNLWSKIPGDLSTYFVSVDYHWAEKKMGFGFLMLNDNEGLHHVRANRIELIYSYRAIQEKDKMLQFGVSVFSLNIRDFQTGGLVFTDQLNPINQDIGQSTFINDNTKPVLYPDWNAGMVYRRKFGVRYKMTPTIGVSVSHILRPNISFINNIVRLPVKYVVNASLRTQLPFNKHYAGEHRSVYVNPGFIYEYQKPFQTFTLGSDFNADPFRLGMWFRNRSYFSDDAYKFNSIIIHAGIVISISSNRKLPHDLIIDYTYDSTISKLEFAAGGAHEITLIYNISLPRGCNKEWY